ncbi:MAG: hypothetical protein ABI472_00355 [Ginsengibacter sp.]
MLIHQNSRRNFLSSMAILSAAVVCKPVIKNLASVKEEDDLRKKWRSFWEKSGGQKCHTSLNLQAQDNFSGTCGHSYRNGETIYFPRENIVAHPTWIYWETHISKPADAVITLIDGTSLKKISRLNRFEMDALYKVSKDNPKDNLLTAHCNSQKQVANISEPIMESKTIFTENKQILQLSYRKMNVFITNKKYIYHF